ncbi:MAG: hypothetical protein ACREYF_06180 [Gammaproteobacteria bacterium]
MNQKLLPVQFADLEPLAERWSLATQQKRENRRRASTPMEIRAVYDTLLPRMDTILDYLNQYTLDNLPEEAKRLMYLTFALAEVAPYVECYHSIPQVPNSFEDTRLIAVHGDRVG